MTYILKLIILAESDNETYRYLMDNQQVISRIEKGEDFPEDYKKKRGEDGKDKESLNLLDQSRKLLQLPPYSDKLEVELAELFYQIGFFEERVPDPREFLNSAKKNPNEAIDFVKETPGNWAHFVGQIISSITKSLEVIKADPNKGDDPNIVTPVKNEIDTVIKLISQYGNKGSKEHKKLFESLSILFPPLNQNITKVLDDKETQFLELALEFGTKEFLQQYLATEKFNDFNCFNQIINNLSEQKISESELADQILLKLQSFFDPNLIDVINSIKAKKLFNVKNSEEFQGQIVNYFTGQGDPGRRDQLFDLFKESKLIDKNKINIINDLINKKEYLRLKELLGNDLFNQIIISKEINLKDFITSDISDFNDQNCKELITELFKSENFKQYAIGEPRFLNSLSEKIKNISDQSLKDYYIQLFIQPKLSEAIKEIKIIKNYSKILNNIWRTANSKVKSKITRFINYNLKGKKYARRKITRKKTSK